MQTCSVPLHFSVPPTVSGIVLAEREGAGDSPVLASQLRSLLRHCLPPGTTQGAFTRACQSHMGPRSLTLTAPSYQHIHLLALLEVPMPFSGVPQASCCPGPRDERHLPHNPHSPAPLPSSGTQPSLTPRACPGLLPHRGCRPGQPGLCNSLAQEAWAVLNCPGDPGSAANCPIPDRLVQAATSRATCPSRPPLATVAAPVEFLCKQQRLASKGCCCSILCAGETWAVMGTGTCWQPSVLHTRAVTSSSCPDPSGSGGDAGCKDTWVSREAPCAECEQQQDTVLGTTVAPVCRQQEPPRELPGSRQEAGAVQSCTTGILCHLGTRPGEEPQPRSAAGSAELTPARERDRTEVSVPSPPQTVR